MTSAAIAVQNPAQLWDAVVARNRRFDGALFYGVGTTHIYCRPSCPSRRPKPENVQFFFDPDSAEQAGFRACKRCRPRDPKTEQDLERLALVRNVCRAVEKNVDSPLPLKQLSSDLKMNPATLDRAFKQTTGVTIKQYAEARRKLAEMTAELGPLHPSLRQMGKQVEDLHRTINEEVDRFAQSALPSAL